MQFHSMHTVVWVCIWIHALLSTGKFLHHQVASKCLLGHLHVFSSSQDCNFSLVDQGCSFPHTLHSQGAKIEDGRQDLKTGDSTEYSKTVIILILLHLIACSSLASWQLLTLDRAEKNSEAINVSWWVQSSAWTCYTPEDFICEAY